MKGFLGLKEISHILSRIKDKELIEEFFKCMLTPNEIKRISSRWELVKLLNEGISQRRIARDLHISLCKITRGSKELKKENSALKKVIQKFNKSFSEGEQNG